MQACIIDNKIGDKKITELFKYKYKNLYNEFNLNKTEINKCW